MTKEQLSDIDLDVINATNKFPDNDKDAFFYGRIDKDNVTDVYLDWLESKLVLIEVGSAESSLSQLFLLIPLSWERVCYIGCFILTINFLFHNFVLNPGAA